MEAPSEKTLKGKRDRAILATLLYHGLRREELCWLQVKNCSQRRGLMHLRVHGKGGKIRFLPVHPRALMRIQDYLEVAGHGADPAPGCMIGGGAGHWSPSATQSRGPSWRNYLYRRDIEDEVLVEGWSV